MTFKMQYRFAPRLVFLFYKTFYCRSLLAGASCLFIQKLNTQTLNIATIDKDNKTGKYIQKYLKCRAERLGCKDQVVLIKVEEAHTLLGEAALIKVENVS